MKCVVVLGDGMADLPLPELEGRTPLQAARKPNIDALARRGELGMVRTVPAGMSPASDVANLSVMGYDPARWYSGRSPLEAASMGVELGPGDLSLRCNLVTLSGGGRYEDLSMADYSAGEIGSGEARELVLALQERFGDLAFSFHAGVSYRHCLVWKGARGSPGVGLGLTPPHDISLKRIRDWLPGGEACAPLARMMRESRELLSAHPVNAARRARGESEANSIWLWGEGFRPALPSFRALHGIGGSVISAVDLVKGIGICALMRSVEVEGATGNLHSNFAGKAAAALRELESGVDFVYLHVEAPDECGHRHDIEGKVRAIELIDGEIVGPLVAGLERMGDWRVLVLPDHPTPLSLRTHTAQPVPFLACGRGIPASGKDRYDEATAAETGLFVERGHELLGRFLRTGG